MTSLPPLMAGALADPRAWQWIAWAVVPGLLLLPVCHRLIAQSRISWYFASRVVGVALLAYVPWLLSHDTRSSMGGAPQSALLALANGPGLLKFTAGSMTWLVLIFVLAGAGFWWKWGREALQTARRHARPIIVGEVLFLAGFAFAGALRLVSHGIEGQEKFMDMAFLRSCIDSTTMPPFDPWLFHLPINYYYGGYLIMAAPAKWLGTPPEVAYNLATPLLFAMSVSMVFAIGYELLPRVRWALAGVFLVLLAGNFAVLGQLAAHCRNLPHAGPFVFNWWEPSRVIHDRLPGGEPMALINEFPFFAFFHADLHPHLMAIPFALLFAACVLGSPGLGARHAAGMKIPPTILAFRILLAGWGLGLLIWINPFDCAAWGLFAAVVVILPALRQAPLKVAGRDFGVRLALLSAMVFVALLSVLPFLAHYTMPARAPEAGGLIGLAEFRTHPWDFLAIWALPTLVIVLSLATRWQRVARRLDGDRRFLFSVALLSLFGLAVLATGGIVAGALLVTVLALVAWCLDRRGNFGPGWPIALAVTGLLLLLACELVFLRDSYGRGLQRMNTIFKLHFIAWIMIGLALPWFMRTALRLIRHRALRHTYIGALALAVTVAALYPVLAVRERLRGYAALELGEPDYDGLRFLARRSPGDYEAIGWLNANALPGTIMLEAVGPPYGEYSRISVFSPARAVLGWANHQEVWRGEPMNRIADAVRVAYSAPSTEEADAVLRAYRVDYVIIGGIERRDYPPEGLEKFGTAYPVVFASRDGSTFIHRVSAAP